MANSGPNHLTFTANHLGWNSGHIVWFDQETYKYTDGVTFNIPNPNTNEYIEPSYSQIPESFEYEEVTL